MTKAVVNKTSTKAVVNKVKQAAFTAKTLTYQGLPVTSTVTKVEHHGHSFLKFSTANGQKFMVPASEINLLIEK